MRVCDFEWASVARWLVWASDYMQLKEINWSHVTDFSLRDGLGRVKSRKKRVLERITENLSKIERYASGLKQGAKKGLDVDTELVALRSLYSQHMDAKLTVSDQLDRVEHLGKLSEKAIPSLFEEEEADDEIPF
jgi:hypothetical protein